ncbi:hypothetical protein Tco_0624367 [Tanacetum coccineum]|uniref:Uncharacterized protein n=1 Tax=Tanacetum coccineum TaxID=301880 RepID=A0ABQ4WDR6_9ASTR
MQGRIYIVPVFMLGGKDSPILTIWTGCETLGFTLRYENKEYVLDEKIPTIDDDSTQEEIKAYQKHYDDVNKVSCIMASSMSPELQKTFENTWAYEMNQQLKEMFQAKASKEHLDVDKSLMACKSKPRASICTFVLEMKGYFNILESLYMVFDAELSIKIILSSLPADDLSKWETVQFSVQVHNQLLKEMFQAKASKERLDVVKSLIACKPKPRAFICDLFLEMKGKETSIMKLHSLLQAAEQGIKKNDVPSTLAAHVLTVGHNAKKRKTSHSNWKGKAIYITPRVFKSLTTSINPLYSVMSDSDESGVTYTEVSSPFEGLSDIGSPRADDHEYLELPWMPEDPYVEAALQAPPSPDYVPGLEEPEQAPPSPDYVPGPEHANDEISPILRRTQRRMTMRTPRRILLTFSDGGDDGDDEDEPSEEDEDDDVDIEADEYEEQNGLENVLKIIESMSKVRQIQETSYLVENEYKALPPEVSSEVAELNDMVGALILDWKEPTQLPPP